MTIRFIVTQLQLRKKLATDFIQQISNAMMEVKVEQSAGGYPLLEEPAPSTILERLNRRATEEFQLPPGEPFRTIDSLNGIVDQLTSAIEVFNNPIGYMVRQENSDDYVVDDTNDAINLLKERFDASEDIDDELTAIRRAQIHPVYAFKLGVEAAYIPAELEERTDYADEDSFKLLCGNDELGDYESMESLLEEAKRLIVEEDYKADHFSVEKVEKTHFSIEQRGEGELRVELNS